MAGACKTGFVIFAFLLLGIAFSTSKATDYFPLHRGDAWKYHWSFQNRSDDYIIRVVREDPQPDRSVQYLLETVTSLQSFQEWYSKSKGFVRIHKTAYPRNNLMGEYTPAKLFLEMPLRVGNVWVWQGTGIMGVKIEESSRVTGSESIIVPAGKFSALRVESDLAQNGARVTRINWFAKGVGLVKSVTQSNGLEASSVLVDYKVSKL